MNALSNGIKITVEENGKTYHTLDDWGLALGNNNYIGDPEMETEYISIPFRDGNIDISEMITGKRTYKKRALSFLLGGLRDRNRWDAVVSLIRNQINGRICKITLDNDISYYWRGRVYVSDFDRERELGQMKLTIPEAEPYKYDIQTSAEEWLWDILDFETGVITTIGQLIVDGEKTVKIPSGFMLVTPTIECKDITSNTFTVSKGTLEISLTTGSNYDPRLLVNGDDEVTLTFKGKGKAQIIYRGGSL